MNFKTLVYASFLLASLLKIDVSRSSFLIRNRDAYSIVVNITPKRLWNLAIVELERMFKVTRARGHPYLSVVDSCNLCQLKCPLCLSGGAYAPDIERGRMSVETFQKIIAKEGKYLTSMILYNWGEPFLNKNIFKLIKIASDKRIGVRLSTNFQIFDERMAEELIKAKLERLIISVDGSTQEIYSQYRVGGSLDKVIEHTKILIQKKKQLKSFYPIVEFQTVIMKHNEHDLGNIRALAEQLNVDNCTFVPLSLMSGITPEALEYASESQEGYFKSYHEPAKRNLSACFWLYQYLIVDWNGDLYPCCPLSGFKECKFGNIDNYDFNNAMYRAARATFKSKAKQRTICYNCYLAR